jgi:hypothetical protein
VHDTEFYADADFGRWAVTGACLRVVVWRAVGGDGEVLGQIVGRDSYGYMGVFFLLLAYCMGTWKSGWLDDAIDARCRGPA